MWPVSSGIITLACDYLTVARPGKIAPFVVVFLNATLLSAAEVDWRGFLSGSLFILASCSSGMRLNVWTDRDLDLVKKPELYAHLARSLFFHLVLAAAELAVSATCFAYLVLRQDLARALWLLAFTALFNLYSFNFVVPHRGKEYRLKIYDWGNLVTAGGGYYSLWMAGLSGAGTGMGLRTRLLFASFCALLEYSVFLSECATDADEEKASGLQTLPAKLGRFGTVLTAWLACAALTAAWFGVGRDLLKMASAPFSLAPVATWNAVTALLICSGFLYFARKAHSPRLWDRTVDLSFWIMRIGALGIVMLSRSESFA
jgi:hypothetical protein